MESRTRAVSPDAWETVSDGQRSTVKEAVTVTTAPLAVMVDASSVVTVTDRVVPGRVRVITLPRSNTVVVEAGKVSTKVLDTVCPGRVVTLPGRVSVWTSVTRGPIRVSVSVIL